MTKQDIVLQFDYDKWATDRQFAVVSTLDDEPYHRDLRSSHGGIHGTLVHIYGSQEIWIARWLGKTPGPYASPTEISSLAMLAEQWNLLRETYKEFIASLTDETIQQKLSYRTLSGEPYSQALWKQMQHVANHATYHRGQITTMLRQLGVVPVATDLIAFYRTLPQEKRGSLSVWTTDRLETRLPLLARRLGFGSLADQLWASRLPALAKAGWLRHQENAA